MASLLFGGHLSTGLQETDAQATTEPVRTDTQTENATPEWNAVNSDDSGQLLGLSERNLSSKTHPSSRGIYSSTPYDGIDLASQPYNILIDQQVSNSGHAAAKEQTGEMGHGTIWYEEGIEPLNPGNVFGNDYFQRDSISANEGSGNYMTPAQGQQDMYPQAVLSRVATNAARKAHMSTTYGNFFGGPSVDSSQKQAFGG